MIGNDSIKNATSVLDYIFRELAVSYLGRNDLAHVPPVFDDDLGRSVGDEGRGSAAAELAQTISRVASTGFVRGQLNQFVVVQGGHALRKAQAEAESARATTIDIEANVAEIGLLVAQAANMGGSSGGGVDERKWRARRAAEAKLKGYEGDACGSCGNFTLVRNGTCLKCDNCGGTTGCS